MADPIGDAVTWITVIEIFEHGGATPPNAHAAAWEQFVVLAGQGRARCDGRDSELAAGDVLLVPPGAEHVIENTGRGKLYCLTTMTPDEGFADLIRSGVPVRIDDDDRAVLSDRLASTP